MSRYSRYTYFVVRCIIHLRLKFFFGCKINANGVAVQSMIIFGTRLPVLLDIYVILILPI